MQVQRPAKQAEPAKRGRGKKRTGNCESYYPQYLAERHFPSSQDPLAITVQVEIDGRKQDQTYPATLTIKHCFDNYFSYFLDLPRELRACIRSAGEILGWSQVDELTIKISLGTPKCEQQVDVTSTDQEPGVQQTTSSNNVDDQRRAGPGTQAPSRGDAPGLSNQFGAASNTASHEMYNPKALEVPINPSVSQYPSQLGVQEMQGSPTDPSQANPVNGSFQELMPNQAQMFGAGGSMQFQDIIRGSYPAAQIDHHPSSRLQGQLLPQGVHHHGVKDNSTSFRNTSYDQPGSNTDTLYYNHLTADAPATVGVQHTGHSLGYGQPPYKRVRYSDGVSTTTTSQLETTLAINKAGQMTMRSLNGGPAMHVRPNSLPDDDGLDAASWDQYMNSMIDPSERLWVPDTSLDAALSGHDLMQPPSSSVPLENGRISAANGNDVRRSSIAANGMLRSPTPQDSANDRSFMGYPQQHLATSPRLSGHATDISPASNQTSSTTLLTNVEQLNGLDCLPQGAAALSRRNSYSPTPPASVYDVSIMVAELLHMVGYLKPSFRDRAILMVALKKCTVIDLASIHAAMKGAWDRKSISEARQILANVLKVQPMTHLVTEGLGLNSIPHGAIQFPYLTPGLQGAAQLEESLAQVLIFLQATPELRAEVLQCLQQMSSSERQVVNTGLVDACVRRSLEDLQGVVYSIITP